jgi:Fur family transcriptional regulator, ferric uptake regulator
MTSFQLIRPHSLPHVHTQPNGAGPSAALAESLTGLGLRRTGPRMAILSILEQAGTHLSATELSRVAIGLHPTINTSTVYRNVAVMRESGLLHSVDHAGETLFGLAGEPHHHLMCDRCGILVEIPAEELAPAAADISVRCGFVLNPAGQVFHGRCHACAS